MAEYRVRVLNTQTNAVLELHAPFYVETRALYSARKQSSMFTSPNIVAVCEVERPQGWRTVGVFRMGRVFRP